MLRRRPSRSVLRSFGLRPVGLLAVGLLAGACAEDDAIDAGATSGASTGTLAAGTSAGGQDGGSGGNEASTGGGAPGTGGGAGTGGEAPTCEGTELDTLGLGFGIGSSVSMGPAPGLGLEQLTVEAWVRRDGAGETFGTGVGGLTMVPIVTKGRGESDGSNVDCNYALGFFGDVLGADFEDMESGGNHPVVGTTTVTWGVWHHVAATYDGASWRLYLDGVLDAESVAGATPRGDSIQHFGLGTAFNSTGVGVGSLEGSLDEVRVWSHARTAAEIAEARDVTLMSGDGLVARWALGEDGTTVADTLGAHDGTAVETGVTTPGAVLDRGPAPGATVIEPAEDAVVDATSARLGLAILELDDEPVEVTFHVRAVGDEDDFTIAVIPDTQYYTRVNDDHDYFYDQVDWIVENREAYNIVGVIHNGDLVDNGDIISQWNVADAAMSTLEAPSAELPDGIPYGLCVGNHEQRPIGTPDGTTNSNVYFGVDRFLGRAYYGGHYGGDNDESWVTFSAGGLDFVVVNMQFNPDPDPAVLAWARGILESHPDAFGIVNSHYIVKANGDFGPQGAAFYEAFKDVQNLHVMTNGHISAEARRSDTFEGHTIHSMLADYQGRPNGGGGTMRIWEMSPRAGEMTVRTYTPTTDLWEEDANSMFTLPIDLSGVTGTFTSLATVEVEDAVAETVFEGLEPGRTYQWYAEIRDCTHTVTTPVSSFTTAP